VDAEKEEALRTDGFANRRRRARKRQCARTDLPRAAVWRRHGRASAGAGRPMPPSTTTGGPTAWRWMLDRRKPPPRSTRLGGASLGGGVSSARRRHLCEGWASRWTSSMGATSSRGSWACSAPPSRVCVRSGWSSPSSTPPHPPPGRHHVLSCAVETHNPRRRLVLPLVWPQPPGRRRQVRS
jgi:hypothetical protein